MVRLLLVLLVLAIPWLGGVAPSDGRYLQLASAGAAWAGQASPGHAPADQASAGIPQAEGQLGAREPGRTDSLQNLEPTDEGAVPRAEEPTLGLLESWRGLSPRGQSLEERRADAPRGGPWFDGEWRERARAPPQPVA